MANLYIVKRPDGLYKTGTVLRRYDECYVRQQLKDVGGGKYTYSDIGFEIPHEKIDGWVIPLNGKLVFDQTSDGVFIHPDSPLVSTENGGITGIRHLK